MSDTEFIRSSLLVLGGLLVWAMHFAFVYGFNTLACARQFSSAHLLGIEIVPLAVAAATGVALIVVVALLLVTRRRPVAAQSPGERERVDAFARYTALAIGGLSLVAILWTALPALLVSPCG